MRLVSLLIPLSFPFVASCAPAQRKPAAALVVVYTPTRAERPLDMPCPLGISDATVLADDVPSGIEITLTSMAHTDELRVRASHASKRYGPMSHSGPGHDGKHGQGHQHGLGLTALIGPITIEYEDVPAGAKLRITANNGSQFEIDRMRTRVRELVLSVASRPCKDSPPDERVTLTSRGESVKTTHR